MSANERAEPSVLFRTAVVEGLPAVSLKKPASMIRSSAAVPASPNPSAFKRITDPSTDVSQTELFNVIFNSVSEFAVTTAESKSPSENVK